MRAAKLALISAFTFSVTVFAAAGLMNLDDLAKKLEEDRQYELQRIHPLPQGFAHHFFVTVTPYLSSPELNYTAEDIELALRRQNTGMYLLAVELRFAPRETPDGRSICLKPFKKSESRASHWIYLVGTGSQEAASMKQRFAIKDERTNLENLRGAGLMQPCSDIEVFLIPFLN